MRTTKKDRAEMKETWAAVPDDHFKDALDLIADVDDAVGVLEKEHLERLGLCWPADDCRPCHEHRYYCEEKLKGVCRFLKEPSNG